MDRRADADVLETRHSIQTLDQLEEKAEELVERLEHAITVKRLNSDRLSTVKLVDMFLYVSDAQVKVGALDASLKTKKIA